MEEAAPSAMLECEAVEASKIFPLGPSLSILESTIVSGKLVENFFRELHYKISSRILILVFFSKELITCVENTIYLFTITA